MPSTAKKKINKIELVDIIREVFVTKEDAEYIYDKIHDKVIESLLDGYDVNLFGCVAIEAVEQKERVVPNAFGKGDMVLPSRLVLKSRVYPTLIKEWDIVNGK